MVQLSSGHTYFCFAATSPLARALTIAATTASVALLSTPEPTHLTFYLARTQLITAAQHILATSPHDLLSASSTHYAAAQYTYATSLCSLLLITRLSLAHLHHLIAYLFHLLAIVGTQHQQVSPSHVLPYLINKAQTYLTLGIILFESGIHYNGYLFPIL